MLRQPHLGVILSFLITLVFFPWVIDHMEALSPDPFDLSKKLSIWVATFAGATVLYFLLQWVIDRIKEKNWNNHILNMLFELMGNKSFVLVIFLSVLFYWLVLKIIFSSSTITQTFLSLLN